MIRSTSSVADAARFSRARSIARFTSGWLSLRAAIQALPCQNSVLESTIPRCTHGAGVRVGGFVEREVIATGIGGQGIQLAAEVLARAATAEGREVLMFGSYGGMMRGGNTDA